MTAFITSFFLVLVAEMGDKTQLLAMAFATRYKPGQVLLGVFLATFCLNLLAVAVGSLLSSVIPLGLLSFLASVSFIVFGLWTLKGEDAEEDAPQKTGALGPVLTVATAFFIAEMGDKTQLAAVSLTVESRQPLMVLAGATLGMTIADGMGVVAGSLIGKRIQPQLIRWASATLFVLFGCIGIYQAAASRFGPVYAVAAVSVVALTTLGIAWSLQTARRSYEGNDQ